MDQISPITDDSVGVPEGTEIVHEVDHELTAQIFGTITLRNVVERPVVQLPLLTVGDKRKLWEQTFVPVVAFRLITKDDNDVFNREMQSWRTANKDPIRSSTSTVLEVCNYRQSRRLAVAEASRQYWTEIRKHIHQQSLKPRFEREGLPNAIEALKPLVTDVVDVARNNPGPHLEQQRLENDMKWCKLERSELPLDLGAVSCLAISYQELAETLASEDGLADLHSAFMSTLPLSESLYRAFLNALITMVITLDRRLALVSRNVFLRTRVLSPKWREALSIFNEPYSSLTKATALTPFLTGRELVGLDESHSYGKVNKTGLTPAVSDRFSPNQPLFEQEVIPESWRYKPSEIKRLPEQEMLELPYTPHPSLSGYHSLWIQRQLEIQAVRPEDILVTPYLHASDSLVQQDNSSKS